MSTYVRINNFLYILWQIAKVFENNYSRSQVLFLSILDNMIINDNIKGNSVNRFSIASSLVNFSLTHEENNF